MAEPGTLSTPPTNDAAPSAGPSLLSRLKVLIFVTLVIGGECCVAYWYLPSLLQPATAAAEAPAHAAPKEKAKGEAKTEAKGEAKAEPAGEAKGGGHEAKEEHAEQMEADLGQFTVTAFQPVSNSTLRIDFHLFGTVAKADEKDFTARWEGSKHRIREQVIVTVRSAEIADLTDAGLGLIKRVLLDKANKTLGKPLIQSIIFSDFSLVEQ